MSEITKRALENALKTLLLKKPLNKITISDVTEECGVNRMTFYYHFKDIYDLVEWCCLEDAGKALQDKKTYDTWEQGLTQIFYAVKENKPFIMNVYRCVSREQVEAYLSPLVDKLLMGVIEEQSAGMTVRKEDKDFVAKIYSYIYVGLMLLSAYVFGAALLLLVGSLGVSIWEIQISVRALEIHLKDMENPLDKRDSE